MRQTPAANMSMIPRASSKYPNLRPQCVVVGEGRPERILIQRLDISATTRGEMARLGYSTQT